MRTYKQQRPWSARKGNVFSIHRLSSRECDVKGTEILTLLKPAGSRHVPLGSDGRSEIMKVLVALFLLAASGPALAAESDGRWSVLLVTEHGDCEVYRWQVVLQNGQILPSANLPAQPAGGVNARGQVDLTFTRGNDTLAAVGDIQGGAGVGTWTAPAKGCSGRWQAERRGRRVQSTE
jgi:hypothetical protein